MSHKKVILVYGGKSGEHEVSLRSAASVLRNLNAEKFTVIPIGMDKTGCFFLNDYHELKKHEALPVITEKSQSLPSLLLQGKLAIEADVVFPVVHGPLYEDGCLQGLLELADTAYVGCDVLASAIGMDKDIARRLACDEEIKCARYESISWYANAKERKEFCEQVANNLKFPLFVKPCSLGSSVGIHKAKTMQELLTAVDDALRYDEVILVEENISGLEIELSVLENVDNLQEPLVSYPGEIKVHHQDGFYSYSAKYLESEMTELIVPAVLEPSLIRQLQKTAGMIFKRLKCKGMARVDFFVEPEKGQIYFNEINTLPGFTSISMYPKLWQYSGISYPDLLDRLITLALTHYHCKKQLVTDYQ